MYVCVCVCVYIYIYIYITLKRFINTFSGIDYEYILVCKAGGGVGGLYEANSHTHINLHTLTSLL